MNHRVDGGIWRVCKPLCVSLCPGNNFETKWPLTHILGVMVHIDIIYVSFIGQGLVRKILLNGWRVKFFLVAHEMLWMHARCGHVTTVSRWGGKTARNGEEKKCKHCATATRSVYMLHRQSSIIVVAIAYWIQQETNVAQHSSIARMDCINSTWRQ